MTPTEPRVSYSSLSLVFGERGETYRHNMQEDSAHVVTVAHMIVAMIVVVSVGVSGVSMARIMVVVHRMVVMLECARISRREG